MGLFDRMGFGGNALADRLRPELEAEGVVELEAVKATVRHRGVRAPGMRAYGKVERTSLVIAVTERRLLIAQSPRRKIIDLPWGHPYMAAVKMDADLDAIRFEVDLDAMGRDDAAGAITVAARSPKSMVIGAAIDARRRHPA